MENVNKQRRNFISVSELKYGHMRGIDILVFQNNKTAAMLVFQTNPVGVELFSYVNTSFCSHKFA